LGVRRAGPRPDGGPPAGNPSPPVYQVPESFDAFYAREYPGLVRLALVLSGSRHAAEDLAQDALLAAYRNWPQLVQPLAWTRRVVANRPGRAGQAPRCRRSGGAMSLDVRARRAAQAARERVEHLPPPPPIGALVARRRRRSLAAGLLLVVLAGLAGGSVWRTLAPQEQEPLEPGPRPVVPSLPRHVLARIPVGGVPEAVAATDEAVWVASRRTGTVSRLDPVTNRVVATISGLATANAVVVGEGMVWVAGDARIWRIDPVSDRVTASFPVGPGDGGLLAAHGALWVATNGGTVLHLDPATGRVVKTIDVRNPPSALVSLDGAVWVASGGNAVPGGSGGPAATIARIDPGSNRVTTRIPLGADLTHGMAAGAGALWVAIDTGAVLRVDPASGQITASVAVGGIPDSAAAADTVLVSFVDGQDVARIDPASNQVTARVPVGSGPPEVAVGASGAWVTNPQTDTVDRLDPHATR
jgi:YVTN family beta-propeller protein